MRSSPGSSPQLPRVELQSTYDRDYFESGSKSGYRGLTTSTYGRLYGSTMGLIRAAAIRALLRPRTLLDVGCGPGHLVGWLRRWGVEAWGLDASRYIAARAVRAARAYVQVGSITELPYRDGQFQMVTTFDVLEHVPPAMVAAAVSECGRVSDQLVFHRICVSDSLHHRLLGHRDGSHVSMHPKAWWLRLLAGQGFHPASNPFPRFHSGGWFLLRPPGA